ncbi:MAG: hypothetical protein PUP90_05220 [Nostoc sp. S4]|nr:hypothetical protein [Nostoc sp. S4]
MTEPYQDTQDYNQGSDFKLERYKYILQQIHFLNENIFKYMYLFQTLATAIITGGIAVFVSWRKLEITPDIAKLGITSFLGLLIITAIFSIFSIVVGVASWVDYRKEEVELLNETVRPGFRKPARIRNLWRWYETYIVLLIFLVIVFIYFFVESQVIPLIK